MKRTTLLLAALVAMPVALAQSGGMKGMDMRDMPMKGMEMKADKKEAKDTVHQATGVATRLDTDKVTIKHEPVPSMNWPSMTMSFKVKDKAVMDKIKKGEKMQFKFVEEGREYVVTDVK